mmetsp:Transcript_77697/g.155604  ORF Transcript_77697/g.155604 Transcript_77697/m.155604 type:complete len:134 (+) Transcript_77697:725-1126(+)
MILSIDRISLDMRVVIPPPPLLPGLSAGSSQIPFTTPPRMARQLHSKPMKVGLAPLSFSFSFSLSQAAGRLLPTSLVVDERALRLGHASAISRGIVRPRTFYAAPPAALSCHVDFADAAGALLLELHAAVTVE